MEDNGRIGRKWICLWPWIKNDKFSNSLFYGIGLMCLQQWLECWFPKKLLMETKKLFSLIIKLDWLILFICESHVTCQSSSVKAFFWYQRSFPLLVIFNNICLTTHIFEILCLLSFSGMYRVLNNSRWWKCLLCKNLRMKLHLNWCHAFFVVDLSFSLGLLKMICQINVRGGWSGFGIEIIKFHQFTI